MQATKTVVAISAAAAMTLAGGVSAVVLSQQGNSTKVLGEKVTGSGSSASSSNGNGNSNGHGNGNGNGNGGKTFTISGTVGGLYPGGTVHLQLTTASTESQDMIVQSLSASLTSIVKAADHPGTCSPSVVIDSWTGSPFTLPKHSTVQAPGYIPITISSSATDACQGATFNLDYTGTAVQK